MSEGTCGCRLAASPVPDIALLIRATLYARCKLGINFQKSLSSKLMARAYFSGIAPTQMPPQDGFTIAHFLTVADIERLARFYETVFFGIML
jgi:hypothetical protein